MLTLKKQHRRYSKTCQADIGYLKNYPSRWDLERLRFSISLNPVKSSAGLSDDTEISFVPMEKVSEDGKIDAEETKFVEDVKDGYTYFAEDDVLMAKITPCFENGKGCVAKKLVNDVGFGSTEFTVLRPNKDVDSRFLYYLTYSDEFRKNGEQEMRGSAGQKRVPDLFVKNYWFAKPSLHDQKAISKYLDSKIQLIESILKQKQKQIGLLKEKRVSLIHRYVTRGIDNRIKMKDSGVSWIGEVPESWELRKMTWNSHKIGSGTTPKSDNKSFYENGSIPWVITGDLNDGILKDTSKKITELALKECSGLKMFPKKSLVIAMYGATIGKLAILDIKACTNQACCVIQPNKKLNIMFCFYWLLANKQNIINLSYGGGQPNISQDVIKRLRMPIPPIQVQNLIVEVIEKNVQEIDKSLDQIELSIKLLYEYKTSLITNVVTGKIQVI